MSYVIVYTVPMGSNNYTFNLLKKMPGFIDGVASILDFSNPQRKYNYSETDTEADCIAIRGDWMAIGHDMQDAIKSYVEEARVVTN